MRGNLNLRGTQNSNLRLTTTYSQLSNLNQKENDVINPDNVRSDQILQPDIEKQTSDNLIKLLLNKVKILSGQLTEKSEICEAQGKLIKAYEGHVKQSSQNHNAMIQK